MAAHHRAANRPLASAAMPQRFEAEDFSGIGRPGPFRAKPVAAASSGEVVQVQPGGNGTISLDLGGVAAGFYQLRIVYLDETDGVSTASAAVNGTTLGGWSFDGAAGAQVTPGAKTGAGLQAGNWRSITLDQGFAVDAGSVLFLTVGRDGGESARIDYVELIAANAAPTDLALNSTTVNEGNAGAVVGRLTVTDPNPGDAFAFTVDDPRFTVNADGLLKLKSDATLDFETESALTVTVTATDSGGLSYSEAFALTVVDREAEIDLVGLDGPLLGDRLAFSHLETSDGRLDKDVATLRIVNTGGDPLHVSGLALSGPFALVDPGQAGAATLAPGASLDVSIAFDRALYDPAADPDIFSGTLTVSSDDADEPGLTIDLAGFWQSQPEHGQEPTVNEVWQTFGYANTVPVAALDHYDIVETASAEEVLSAYWRLADGVTAATVTWLASYHGKPATSIALHAPGAAATTVTLLTQAANQNQTLLPVTTAGTPNAGIDAALVPDGWAGADAFGFSLQGESSDPTLNAPGPGTPPAPDANAPRGHFLRFFQALDGNGDAIPDTYLLIEDYNSKGVNYDYNDNMFLLTGITPVDVPLP